MPTRVQWEAEFGVGDASIDAQHRAMLDLCNRLADACLATEGVERERSFDERFAKLEALVHEHLAAERTLLAGRGDPDCEDPGEASEEFDYLVGEIATTEHFDRLELQRFLALWCVGHITGSARQLRAAGSGT